VAKMVADTSASKRHAPKKAVRKGRPTSILTDLLTAFRSAQKQTDVYRPNDNATP
jgi:hypothetical protein